MANDNAQNPVIETPQVIEPKQEVTANPEQQTNNDKPLTGFQLHPELINRKGRPPKLYSITATVQAMMDETPEVKKMLAKRILRMAIEGDFNAIKLLWNYMDGMPEQFTELRARDNIPLLLVDANGGQTNSINASTDESPTETGASPQSPVDPAV